MKEMNSLFLPVPTKRLAQITRMQSQEILNKSLISTKSGTGNEFSFRLRCLIFLLLLLIFHHNINSLR